MPDDPTEAAPPPVPLAPPDTMPVLQAAGPLAGRSALFGESVALGIPAAMARLNLRAPAGSASMTAAMQELGEAAWPPPANRWAALGPDRQLVWLGPDEALLLGGDAAIAEARVQLGAVLGDAAAAAITDVGDGAATIRLSGPRSAEVLAKGCPLDLAALPEGAAVQTLLGHLGILLVVLEQGQSYDIHVRSSLAAFAWDWLADAAQEFL